MVDNSDLSWIGWKEEETCLLFLGYNNKSWNAKQPLDFQGGDKKLSQSRLNCKYRLVQGAGQPPMRFQVVASPVS